VSKLSWRAFNKQLGSFTETQLLDMITEELRTYKRISVLERMHQRYNILRVTREREELLTKATASPTPQS
jgi:hypothetical protein